MVLMLLARTRQAVRVKAVQQCPARYPKQLGCFGLIARALSKRIENALSFDLFHRIAQRRNTV